ncbi:MAG TPA: hypothetical protein VHP14_16990 [Anaerolineales bacterium]|nr:hypothetical protein [Anaerolineales bacterium]
MNKLNVHNPSLIDFPAAEPDVAVRVTTPERCGRLVVLVPPDVDCARITRRICKLATETKSDVQLLGLCKDPAQELVLRRELVTVSALIQDVRIYSEVKIEVGTNWLDAVKRNYQDGDAIVCLTDLSIGIRQRPFSQILESTLKAPIYILSEKKPTQSRSSILSQVLAWSGFLAIIVGFFILQVKLVQLSKDWTQTVILILLLIPEFGALWLWNLIFS